MEIHHFFAGIFYKKQHKTTKSERKKAVLREIRREELILRILIPDW